MPLSSDYLGQYWELGQSISYSFNASSLGGYNFSSYYQSTFETAMSQWSSVANITFVETSNPWSADWVIGWDPAPDGYGGTLGWASNYDFDGDGVMESAEGDFSIIAMDIYDTSYFYTTAIHEAGHALGLDHIDHTSSIMATYENGLQGLTSYDVEVIQALYGAVGSTNADTTGTDGNDTLIGSSGNDTMWGADGQDTLSGGSGNDVLYGNKGVDYIIGSDGADSIFGGQNDGTPSGSPLAQRDGWDTISGGDGNDLLYGNHGNDILDGGDGWDTIFGGQNDDSIFGGSGSDDLYGNLGADSFVFTDSYEGFDYIHDFDTSEDKLQLVGSVSISTISSYSSSTYVGLSSGTTIKLVGVSISDATSITEYVT